MSVLSSAPLHYNLRAQVLVYRAFELKPSMLLLRYQWNSIMVSQFTIEDQELVLRTIMKEKY